MMDRKRKSPTLLPRDINHIDYRDVHLLRTFLDSYGKLLPRHRTKLSMRHQQKVATAVKQSRYMAFLPYVEQ